MKKRIIIYIVGILSGVLICGIYAWTTQKDKNVSYVVLPYDYKIGELGILKKGLKLKIDAPEERFTRYILYLNAWDWEAIELDTTKNKFEIKPYWIQRADTTK